MHTNGLWEDWRERSDFIPRPEGWLPGRGLGVTGALWSIGEYFLLASRLALSLNDASPIVVWIRLHGLKERELTISDPRRMPFHRQRTTASNSFDTGEREYPIDELIAGGKDLAVETATQLFSRFG